MVTLMVSLLMMLPIPPRQWKQRRGHSRPHVRGSGYVKYPSRLDLWRHYTNWNVLKRAVDIILYMNYNARMVKHYLGQDHCSPFCLQSVCILASCLFWSFSPWLPLSRLSLSAAPCSSFRGEESAHVKTSQL